MGLDVLYFTTPSCRVTATDHRSNDLILGSCNCCVVLPNGPEMELVAFLDAAVWTYCGSSDEEISARADAAELALVKRWDE